MHVEIVVVAKDYEAGKQATRKEEVEISPRVLKLYEMFVSGKGPDELLRWVADTIYGVAIREAQGGGKRGSVSDALVESGGGRVGGRGTPGQNEIADNLGEALGLDVIRADVRKQQQENVHAPQGGPGPVGFQKPNQQTAQPVVGPGPVGFGGDRQINPGPGPGPIGFPKSK